MFGNRGLVIFITVTGVLFFVVVGYYLLTMVKKNTAFIDSFDSCVKAGNPILETYPAQCKTPDGKNFIEEISEE